MDEVSPDDSILSSAPNRKDVQPCQHHQHQCLARSERLLQSTNMSKQRSGRSDRPLSHPVIRWDGHSTRPCPSSTKSFKQHPHSHEIVVLSITTGQIPMAWGLSTVEKHRTNSHPTNSQFQDCLQKGLGTLLHVATEACKRRASHVTTLTSENWEHFKQLK